MSKRDLPQAQPVPDLAFNDFTQEIDCPLDEFAARRDEPTLSNFEIELELALDS